MMNQTQKEEENRKGTTCEGRGKKIPTLGDKAI